MPKCFARGSLWYWLMIFIWMVSGTNSSPDDTVTRWCSPSRQAAVSWTWVLGPLGLTPAALIASTSCHQCWLYTDFHQLAPLAMCPRIDVVGRARESRKWELDGEAIVWLRCWGLRGWHWSMKTVGVAEFWHSRLEGSLPPLHFTEDIETGRQ